MTMVDRRTVLGWGLKAAGLATLPGLVRCGNGQAGSAVSDAGFSDLDVGGFDTARPLDTTRPADTSVPGRRVAVPSFVLGTEVTDYASFNLPKDQFVVGLALRNPTTALVVAGSFASPASHSVFTVALQGSGVVIQSQGTVPFRPVGAPIVHPKNPDTAFVGIHDLAKDLWGAAQLYGATVALEATVAGTYVGGIALATDPLFPSGLLAIGASDFSGETFGEDSVTLFDLQKYAVSGKAEGSLVIHTVGKNVGGMAPAVINDEAHLVVTNAGSISSSGQALNAGALSLVTLADIADGIATGREPTQVSYLLPGGLNLRQGVAIAQMADAGPLAVLPSAVNDGRVYFAPLAQLAALEAERVWMEKSVLDLPYVTLPDAMHGALAFINVGDPSPDGRWIVASNLNSGRLYVIDLLAKTVVNPEGIPLDLDPLDAAVIGTGVWTNAGYVIPLGNMLKLIPYA